MEDNVFGEPITNSTLKEMPEYKDKEITRTDRAHVALQMRNAKGKYDDAKTFVDNHKKQSGDGVATKCLVYNATGDAVNFVTHHDWLGNIERSHYPTKLENGQWAAFLHVKSTAVPIVTPAGSVGAVVYRGKNEAGNECEWMLSWSNPWNRVVSNNKVYTEISKADHYENTNWAAISDQLEASSEQHSKKWNGCLSYVSTDHGTTVKFEATMTLENA